VDEFPIIEEASLNALFDLTYGKVFAEGAKLENRIDHYFINGQLTPGAEEFLAGANFRVNPAKVNQNLNIYFNLFSKSDIQIVVNDAVGNEVLH